MLTSRLIYYLLGPANKRDESSRVESCWHFWNGFTLLIYGVNIEQEVWGPWSNGRED